MSNDSVEIDMARAIKMQVLSNFLFFEYVYVIVIKEIGTVYKWYFQLVIVLDT